MNELKNKYPSIKKGFTLIELLIVIAIIGIIAGVILVSTNASRTKANNSQFIQHARSSQGKLSIACNADVTSNVVLTTVAAGVYTQLGLVSADVVVTGNCAGITVKPTVAGKYAGATTICKTNGVVITMFGGLVNAAGSDCK